MITRTSALIDFKAAPLGSSGEFEGHGATFGNVDLGGDVVMRGAFKASLAAQKADGVMPGMFWSHDPSEPIGKWLDVREDDIGLKVHGKLTLEVPRAAAAYALMKDQALALSIGYTVGEHDYDSNGVRRLKQIDLWEISPVALPMNRRARIAAVKSALTDVRTLERLAREDWGWPMREARRLASGYLAYKSRDVSTADDPDPEFIEHLRACDRRW